MTAHLRCIQAPSAPPAHIETISYKISALRAALEAQPAEPASGGPELVRVHLFTLGDSEHIVLGAACEELEANTYRAVSGLGVEAPSADALLRFTERCGLEVTSGPSWLLVHDLS